MAAPRRRRALSALGPEAEIPDKLYFKIGEVAVLVGVQAHVLRYWEKEIPFIRPGKTSSNQRRYRRRDVEVFREIRRLLHQERYTLAGARRRLLSGDKSDEAGPPEPKPVATPPVAPQLAIGFARPLESERLARVKDGLRELLAMVGEEP